MARALRGHGAPLLPSGHPGRARMNVCVGPLVAAIGTGISIELMDSDTVGGGCSSTVEVASSLASEGMHTRSPISRMVAELYGTAISRPLLMHTPPCLPPDEGSGQRESSRHGHRILAKIDGFALAR